MRACIIDFGGSWDSYLPIPKFFYNNNYISSIGAPPYELLHGRQCRTPVCWGEISHQVMEKTKVVLQMMKLI